MRFKLIFLLTFLILFVSISAHSKVRLRDVTTLTLQRGQYTQGRRSQPVPQLRCVGGTAQGQYAPAVVQCYNRGSDGRDVQWECKASMPKEYEFGRISVSCEGYDYPEDPFILAGSCGLEYELNNAPIGSAQYAKRTPSAPYENDEESQIHWKGIIYFGIVCFILYLLYLTLSGPTPGNEGDRNRGGFGYGPGHPPGPGGGPPPPGFRPYPPSYDEATKPTFTSSTSAGSSTTGQPAAGGGGPGFFSGLAAGALGGYFFGNRNNDGGTYRRRGWGGGGNQRGYGWGSGWGGGAQTQFDRDTGFGGSSSTYQSYETSPPSSSSASRHTSTSFGGTTRR